MTRTEDSTLLLEDCKIWTPTGFSKASILLADGRIAAIKRIIPANGAHRYNAQGLVALPGLVDAHVHLRDLDLSYKEDFDSGTAAAAAGGFTTVLDMPNTRPVTDSARRLREKIGIARGRIRTNVGFHVAAVRDSNEIERMSRAGAFSLKLYMPRPIAPLNVRDDAIIARTLAAAKRAGLPVIVHAEDRESIRESRSTSSFLELARDRPEEAETRAVDRVLRLAEKTGCQIHLAHLTLPASIEQARRYRNVTTEVTPHHVLLTDRTLASKGWRAWMVPPLRSESARRGLLRLVSSDLVDIVASDHAPHAIREKSRSHPDESPPGIPGLETTLPLMLTLAKRGILPFQLIPQLLSSGPSHIFHLPRKGRLQKDYDADIVLVDMKSRWRIREDRFKSKAKYSPFNNMPVVGRVHATIVSGNVVFENGELVAKPGSGEVLTRKR